MILLDVKRNPVYLDDVIRIVDVCTNSGFIIAPSVAQAIWKTYSDESAAGWLPLPKIMITY